MAKRDLTLAWSEIAFAADDFHKIIRNTGPEPVTLLFADTFPPGEPEDSWDVYTILPGELVNVHFSTYRPRVFVRGKRGETHVLTTITTLGADGIAGVGQTITPKASGIM